MQYIEYKVILSPLTPWNEILIATLSELNFDTFIEHEDGFSAFITSELNNEEEFVEQFKILPDEVIYSYEKITLEDVNWNEEWEKNFEPIIVDDLVYLRADFHPERPEIPYQINIQPKMSFGTGHHETTYLMLKLITQMDFSNETVLDMGCGTSVLALLAKMKNAKKVIAIDNDSWAYENSLENIKRNNLEIEVFQGDASLLGEIQFETIFANINKNILLQDMEKYVEVLKKGGILMMSGIYHFDVDDILEEAESLGLELIQKEVKNDWVALKLKLID